MCDSRVQWTAISYILGKMLLSSHVQLSADLLNRGLVGWRSKKICTQGYRPQVYEWMVHWQNYWELEESGAGQLPFYGFWQDTTLASCGSDVQSAELKKTFSLFGNIKLSSAFVFTQITKYCKKLRCGQVGT